MLFRSTVDIFSCGRILKILVDVRVETQGEGRNVCAVRIGPTVAAGSVDPAFIEAWFVDKQLGARARALASRDNSTGDYDQMTTLDGIRIAVKRTASRFYLAVDGCGRVPDPGAGASWIH